MGHIMEGLKWTLESGTTLAFAKNGSVGNATGRVECVSGLPRIPFFELGLSTIDGRRADVCSQALPHPRPFLCRPLHLHLLRPPLAERRTPTLSSSPQTVASELLCWSVSDLRWVSSFERRGKRWRPLGRAARRRLTILSNFWLRTPTCLAILATCECSGSWRVQEKEIDSGRRGRSCTVVRCGRLRPGPASARAMPRWRFGRGARARARDENGGPAASAPAPSPSLSLPFFLFDHQHPASRECLVSFGDRCGQRMVWLWRLPLDGERQRSAQAARGGGRLSSPPSPRPRSTWR